MSDDQWFRLLARNRVLFLGIGLFLGVVLGVAVIELLLMYAGVIP